MTTVNELLGKPVFAVIVKPQADKTAILGVRSDAVHIALKAPPIEGKANDALLKFLKKHTGNDYEIISGVSSKKKLLKVI